jgi:hypothetical protein
MPIQIDAAAIAAQMLRTVDERDRDTVDIDERTIGVMEADLDRATIVAARDLERRIRACGKHADADVVRSLVNRVVNLTGETL